MTNDSSCRVGSRGTVALAAGASAAIRTTEVAMRSEGNIDALYFALAKHAREVGHNSIVLHQMGIPERPALDSTDPR